MKTKTRKRKKTDMNKWKLTLRLFGNLDNNNVEHKNFTKLRSKTCSLCIDSIEKKTELKEWKKRNMEQVTPSSFFPLVLQKATHQKPREEVIMMQ